MKLMHPIFEKPITFEETSINVLIVENKQIFSQLIGEMINQIDGKEGEFILSRDGNIIEISKTLDIIIDPFSIDINNRKIITRLHNKLSKIAMEEERYIETLEINRSIIEFINKLAEESQNDIIYSLQINVIDIFKIADVKLNNTFCNILEKIMNYIGIVHEFTDITCFIFINLKNFFSQEEIKEFYKFIVYNKYDILLIESTSSGYKLELEKTLIIDEDLCII